MAGIDTTGTKIEISPESIDSGDISRKVIEELGNIIGTAEVESWSEIDKTIIINDILQQNKNASTVRSLGQLIILEGPTKTIAIDIGLFWSSDRDISIQEISFDQARAQHFEAVSSFKEGIVELEVLSNSIGAVLADNDEEFWEVINDEDVVKEGPFAGKTIVEAVLLYKAKIIRSGIQLRALGTISDDEQPEIAAAREDLYDAQEEYLLLSLGIGEDREELTHVLPKTLAESETLIKNVVERRNPREIIDWMKGIHRQIDANNWQSGTVEKNYSYFAETLNTHALEKIRVSVFEDTGSEYYHDTNVLLEFAILVSGRSAWNKESAPLMEDSSWFSNEASPVDSRLWRSEIAEQALVYAMDVPSKNSDGETKSMIETMMPHIEISEPLLEGKSPGQVVNDTKIALKSALILTDPETGVTSSPSDSDVAKILEGYGYKNTIDRAKNRELDESYQGLSLEDMIAISGLVRISHQLESKQTQVKTITGDTPYIAKEGETVKTQENYGPGPRYFSTITTHNHSISLEEFGAIAGNAAQSSIKHVGDELDRNFDDTWKESYDYMMRGDQDRNGNWHDDADRSRAEKFGLSSDANSTAYQIFTLLADIKGNGNPGEFSDSTIGGIKTAGFLIAMIAGSMLIGGGAIFLLGRTGMVVTSIAGKGAIMGVSGSGLGYGLDALAGDARGFYSPSEAFIGVGSDFILGAGTGALSGPLAQLAPNGTPDSLIFATDLAALGLGPEIVRMNKLNKIFHGDEIHVEGMNALDEKIQEIQASLLPGDSFFKNEFHTFGFENHPDITSEFNAGFQKAYAIWKVLSPGNSLNIWQAEPEFDGVIQLQADGLAGVQKRIIEATKKWIERQNKRLDDITGIS